MTNVNISQGGNYQEKDNEKRVIQSLLLYEKEIIPKKFREVENNKNCKGG